jgi:hypothetical protein
MSNKSRPILCIDFDGTVHLYSKGWQDGKIYDIVVPGFFEWANKAQDMFRLVIYSSRSKEADTLAEMKLWLEQRAAEWCDENNVLPINFEYAAQKPPAFLTIDDRAVCFTGDWSQLDPHTLIKFKPWNLK